MGGRDDGDISVENDIMSILLSWRCMEGVEHHMRVASMMIVLHCVPTILQPTYKN